MTKGEDEIKSATISFVQPGQLFGLVPTNAKELEKFKESLSSAYVTYVSGERPPQTLADDVYPLVTPSGQNAGISFNAIPSSTSLLGFYAQFDAASALGITFSWILKGWEGYQTVHKGSNPYGENYKEIKKIYWNVEKLAKVHLLDESLDISNDDEGYQYYQLNDNQYNYSYSNSENSENAEDNNSSYDVKGYQYYQLNDNRYNYSYLNSENSENAEQN